MKQALKMTGCVAAALALGGCQNFISALGFAPKESTQSVQMAEAFEPLSLYVQFRQKF